MSYAPAYQPAAPQADAGLSLTRPLVRIRAWLDERGRPAWIVAMILGFVFVWPVGLAILGYMIWSKRMMCGHQSGRMGGQFFYRPGATGRTGNAAFDAYREETLRRLEDEHRAFLDFLAKLREAKDKAEFDQFMEERREA